MSKSVHQDDIDYRQELLSRSPDGLKGPWIDYGRLQKEIERIQRKAKKEAINRISEILSQIPEYHEEGMLSMSALKRHLHPMPDFVKQALIERGLVDAYRNRPPYQRNDYIGWITHAKQEKTQRKRLKQMLDELASGERYMNMVYRAKHF
jgi:uncharacterized protein YdeI (YjbR/CyaY-like superfamily)